MTASSKSTPFLIVAFAMLWAPLGQHAFLVEHWMKVGTFMAPFLLLTAAAARGAGAPAPLVDLRFLAVLLLVAYIAHQFEEHWIDLLGRTYAFHPAVNALARGALGVAESDVEVLSREAVFVINTSLVWLVGALAIACAADRAFPALAMAAIMIVNAVSHVAAAALSATYNPGLATSILIFAPLGVWVYRVALRSGRTTVAECAASVAWAIGAHIVMIVGMLAATWWRLIPESAYFALLALWSVAPLLLGRAVPERS